MSDNLQHQENTLLVTDSPLDRATLNGLRELGDGDPSFLIEVIQQFLHDAPDHMTAASTEPRGSDGHSPGPTDIACSCLLTTTTPQTDQTPQCLCQQRPRHGPHTYK